MHLAMPMFGKLAIVSLVVIIFLLLMMVAITDPKYYHRSNMDVSVSGYHFRTENLDTKKLPRLSGDKKTLVVTEEDALPNAFEFLRLNMYLPIEKIVLVKPGKNDSVRVYPIPREGMLGLGESVSLSPSEIGFVVLFLMFIIGSFGYIFVSISGVRVYWDEEGWLSNDDLLMESDLNELDCSEKIQEAKALLKAEKIEKN